MRLMADNGTYVTGVNIENGQMTLWLLLQLSENGNAFGCFANTRMEMSIMKNRLRCWVVFAQGECKGPGLVHEIDVCIC